MMNLPSESRNSCIHLVEVLSQPSGGSLKGQVLRAPARAQEETGHGFLRMGWLLGVDEALFGLSEPLSRAGILEGVAPRVRGSQLALFFSLALVSYTQVVG